MEKIVIRWTESAVEDLKNIYDFISNSITEDYASQLVDLLYNKPNNLTSGVEIGQREAALSNRKKEYRYLIESHYKIIYSIENKELVIIHTIFDTRQNPAKLINKVK